MSPRRAAVLQTFITLAARQQRPPTVREVADALGIGKSTCHYHIQCLVSADVMGRLKGSRGFYVRGEQRVDTVA
jgi:DNA-binding IclR family transcriptional regulator